MSLAGHHSGHNNLKLAGTWKFQNDSFFINQFHVQQVWRLSFCPLRRLKIIDPIRTPSSGERCTVTRPTLFVIFMVYHYVWLDGLKQRTTSGYFSFRAVTKATAKQNLCLLSVYLAAQCSKAEELDLNREFHVERLWILFTTAVGRFSLTVLRRMTASQFFLAVLLATSQCQTQAYDKVLNGSEDLRNVTKCSWNCKVIESDLLEKINKDLTRTRVTEVAVIYKMKVDEKYCANQTSLNSSTVVTEKLQIWRRADGKPSSFASAFERVLELLFSFNHEAYGELQADCNLSLARRTALHETIKDVLLDDALRGHLGDLEINFESVNITNSTGNVTHNQLIRNNGWVSADSQIFAFAIVFYFAFVYYSPTFLCLFTPIVVTENDIRHISLERMKSSRPQKSYREMFLFRSW